jgi:hypothetical protein
MNDQVNEVPAAEAPAAKPVIEKDIRNGVTRPKDGTKTGHVWSIADRISQENGRPALREEVMAAATADGINKGTIATQYARWTEYHGVSKADRKAVRDQAKADAAPAADPAAEEAPAGDAA